MHNKKAVSWLVLFKTIQNNIEKHKKKENVWRRERNSWTRTVWFGSATKSDIKRLQQTVRTAERNICAPLPNLQDFYISRVRERAKKITLDPTHPAHSLFELLPSGQQEPTTRTARHKNSFLTRAIFSLNNCKTFITIHCPSLLTHLYRENQKLFICELHTCK